MTALEELKHLDPARHIGDDAARGSTAQHTLIAAMNHGDTPSRPERTHKRRGMRAALISTPLVAASGTAAFFVLGTAGTSPAFASWQSTPAAPSAQEASRAGGLCAAQFNDPRYDATKPFHTRVVEKRGDFTYVVLFNSEGREATCFTKGDPANPQLDQGFTGVLKGTPRPDGLVTNSVRQVQSDDGAEKWQEVTGRTGSNVASVEFLVNNTRVKATVKDGYFAAWWPGGKSRFHYGPPNPDVIITLKNDHHVTKQIQDFDTSPM